MSLTVAGCHRNASGSAVASGNMDVLRADEIAKSGATDAYQAIRMLRPGYFQSRGRTSILRAEEAEPAVYLDDRPFGSIDTLRDIPAREIVEVRYFGPAQAQLRWGAGNSAGAILVRTGSPK
ncbi:MAG: hypothetical protein ACT4P7_00135 [Gemmatimonadaceae bacterium]